MYARAARAHILYDLREVLRRLFQADVEGVEGRAQHLPHPRVGHGLHAQAAVEEGGDGLLEGVEVGDVFLAQDEDEVAGQFPGIQDVLQAADEGLLFFPPSQDEQFFQLVEDEVDGAQEAGVEALQAVCQPAFQLAFGGLFQGLPQGAVDIVLPSDEERVPVGGVEAAGQAALYQAGLARARLPVHQHQAVLADGIVEILHFLVPPEEDVLVFQGVGVEEFEGALHREL